METFIETGLIIWSTPIYLVLILAEIIASHIHSKPAYSFRNTLENIYLSLLNGGLDIVCRGFSLFLLGLAYDVKWISPSDNPWIYWISLFIGLDFFFYLLHLVDHKCRIFWAVHVTHHSSEYFNLTVGFRSSVFQPLYRFIYFIPLALAGFQPADILFTYAACQIYGIILHTRYVKKLKMLDWILVTPSHHRVHHGSNPEYLDKNMGMVLIIWDRLFGTFQEETVPVKYGITRKLTDHRPHQIVFHEWIDLIRDVKKASSLKDVLKVVFGAPGPAKPEG